MKKPQNAVDLRQSKAKHRWEAMKAMANIDQLPPHSDEAERGALSCVLQAGDGKPGAPGNQQEVEALLHQLRPAYFYDLRNKTIHRELVQMKMANHAVATDLFLGWLKAQKSDNSGNGSRRLEDGRLEDAGGYNYITQEIEPASPSAFNFDFYLPPLKENALRRWCLAKTARLGELAKATELTPEQLKEEFSEIYEQSASIGNTVPLIQFISPKQAREYVPDPTDYLVGQGLINRGMVVTIGGEPGVGKSRLATTLAVAGARGNNRWMNYPIRCRWRTAMLQSENDPTRLKEESDAIATQYDEHIRMTNFLKHGLAFDSTDFRRELRRFYDSWPFEMLVIDPWNDVTFEEGQRDYKQALSNIKLVFCDLPKKPAIVIVAHLRKKGRDEGARRKTGRELLHELSGSLALGSESRTVFAIQPAVPGMDDPRIVFEIAKANNVHSDFFKEYGHRSAWNRANAAFESIEFDWERWDNPGDPERQKITEEMIQQAFEGEGDLKAANIAKKLKSMFNVGESTVFRAIGEDGYLRKMLQRTSIGTLKLKDPK